MRAPPRRGAGLLLPPRAGAGPVRRGHRGRRPPREFRARVSARSASPPPRPPRPPRRAGFPMGRGRPPGLGRGRGPSPAPPERPWQEPVSPPPPPSFRAPRGRRSPGDGRGGLAQEDPDCGSGRPWPWVPARAPGILTTLGGGRVLPDRQVRPWGSVTIPQVMTHQLFLCKPLREFGAASGSWVRSPVVPRFSHLEYGNHSSTYLAEYCANKRHHGEPRLCPGWGPAWEPGRGPLRRAFARGPRTPACPAPPLCPPGSLGGCLEPPPGRQDRHLLARPRPAPALLCRPSQQAPARSGPPPGEGGCAPQPGYPAGGPGASRGSEGAAAALGRGRGWEG